MRLNKPEIIVCKDNFELYSKSAAAFMSLSREFQSKKGRFNVALAGGSTPLPLYGLLASSPFQERVRWPGVHFFWSDERCVPPEDEESNYGSAALNLLDKIGALEKNIHRIEGELGASAAHIYERELRSFFVNAAGETPSFDLILLGMGGDGHTASLFPGSASLSERDKLVTSEYVEKLDSTRVTFTPPLIQKAANIIFLVSGAGKAAALKSVLEGEPDPAIFPASLTRNALGSVRWFVDTEAASMLAGGY